jgi:adenylate cyclase
MSLLRRKATGICCILYLLSMPAQVFAQNNDARLDKRIDSIENLRGTDTQKINRLWQTAWGYQTTNFEKARKYLGEAEKLSLKTGYNKGLIEIYNRTGAVFFKEGKYDSALYFYIKCVKLREKLRDFEGISHNYANIGTTYTRLNDSTKAIYYLQLALETDAKKNDPGEIAGDYINLGTMYLTFDKITISRSWFNKALPLLSAAKDRENLAKTYNNIGISYYSENDYPKTLAYFRLAAEQHKLANEMHELADTWDNMGGVYQMVNMDSAYHYLQLALDLAKKTGAASILVNVYDNLKQYYDTLHDYKNAYKYYQLQVATNDSLLNIEKSKTIAELQTKYDSEKDKEKISSLTSEKRFQGLLRNSLIGFGLMALVIVYIQISRYRRQKKSMVIITEEKARSESLLLNILPYETAEELKKYGKTTARRFESVHVLFTDIKGFTLISEKMSPEDLVKDLDMYFSTFDSIIARHELEKIKTIGDAYLAVGGLPNPARGSARDIILAAIEMQQYVEQLKKEREANGQPYFQIRLGINTGPVVAGVVGTKKFQYDIWGDTVNTAARMEENCLPGKINISAATYEYIKNDFLFTNRGFMEVKNKGMMEMYFVEGILY